MARLVKNTKKVGTAPGSLIHTGNYKNDVIDITLIEYNKDIYHRKKLNNIEDCFKLRNSDTVKWVNVEGLNDVSIIEKIGKEFKLHPLMLEDILNTSQRPKMDDYDDYIYIVLKMLYYNEKNNEISSEQLSFVYVDNYVFTFQEFGGDVFDGIRERLETAKGNVRKLGADYLIYGLIDAIVDSYFIILEKIGDNTEDIEQELMEDPKKEVLQSIYKLKREMIFLNNSIWPLRELVSALARTESSVFDKNTSLYFRDVYDHIIQVIDIIESYRDMVSGMLDTYLSSISNRTNDVMKVLTIFSTMFIPLTFLVGIYGMNFENMPELKWRYGYIVFWLLTVIIIYIMLRYFKRKKWL